MVQKTQFFAGGPVVQLAADVAVHAVQVAGQGRFLEGLLHDAPVKFMVGKITQH